MNQKKTDSDILRDAVTPAPRRFDKLIWEPVAIHVPRDRILGKEDPHKSEDQREERADSEGVNTREE